MSISEDKAAIANVLVVDSDTNTFELIQELLESETTIHYAKDTTEAISLLKTKVNEIGIIICSEYLEGEHGLQFMVRIDK